MAVYAKRGMKFKRTKGGKLTKMAKGKETSIRTLAKAVKALQAKGKTEADYFNLQQTGYQVNVSSGAPFALQLSNYNNMGYCFGTGSDEVGTNAVIHKAVGIDAYVSLENLINNEEETVQFTAFLVSLKDAATQIFNMQTNSFLWNSTAGAAGQTHAIVGGLTMLNKRYFNIHKVKRFVLTNHGTALTAPSAQTQYGTDIRWYWKQAINKKIVNPSGNWYSLINGADPSKTYFMLLFNDNSSADAESPNITYAAVHTMKAV